LQGVPMLSVDQEEAVEAELLALSQWWISSTQPRQKRSIYQRRLHQTTWSLASCWAHWYPWKRWQFRRLKTTPHYAFSCEYFEGCENRYSYENKSYQIVLK
jgi:hypothetical protein